MSNNSKEHSNKEKSSDGIDWQNSDDQPHNSNHSNENKLGEEEGTQGENKVNIITDVKEEEEENTQNEDEQKQESKQLSNKGKLSF